MSAPPLRVRTPLRLHIPNLLPRQSIQRIPQSIVLPIRRLHLHEHTGTSTPGRCPAHLTAHHPLRRTVDKLVQVRFSKLILSGEIHKHKAWQLSASEDGIAGIPQ